MTLNEPLPNTQTMVEPKATNKYQTKKEKEKDTVVEELMIVAQTMVGEELHDEEAQTLKEYMEEAAKPAPQITKKKKKIRKDEMGLSKAKAYERTPSHVKQRKGRDKVIVGSLVKTLTAFKKHNGKGKNS